MKLMGVATVLVWNLKKGGMKMGYVFGNRKLGRIKAILKGYALWVETFEVGGWDLRFNGITTISEADLREQIRKGEL